MERKEWLRRWKNNGRYTLKFIALIKEDELDFKATENGKSFRSQVQHISAWLRNQYKFLSGEELRKNRPKSKEELHSSLEEFFEFLHEFLLEVSEEELEQKVELWFGTISKASLLMTMENHLAHHRGQLVIYLRQLGYNPPSYIGW